MTNHMMCPRCRRVVRMKKDGKFYQHNVLPENSFFGKHCPYSGVTYEDAQNKITRLARRLLDTGHVKNSETGKWEKK